MYVPQEKVAQGVCSILVHNRVWINHIAERFGHLLPVACDKTVDKNLFRGWQSCGQQHRLPHSGLLANLVLATQLNRLRRFFGTPKLLELCHVFWPTKCGNVIYEGIKPHIHDMVWVVWHTHSPGHFCFKPRDGKIRET